MEKINLKEVTICTACPICGRGNFIEVNEMDYLDWSDGALAIEAFPYLEPAEREMLISGICPECWKKMWGDDDEAVS